MSATYTHRNLPPRHSVHSQARTAPAPLAQLLQKAAQELKLLAAEVNLVEREIEEFNQFYYAEVGALYEKYKQMKMETQAESSEEFALPDVSAKVEKTDATVAALSKKIFRRVAKICHPDSNDAAVKPEFFVKLNDAYKAQDLGGLLLLEQHLYKQTQAETRHFQEEQLMMIERAKEIFDQRKNDLVNSPAYKLRQKIFWAKMGGQDLLAQIKRHMEHQIAVMQFAA